LAVQLYGRTAKIGLDSCHGTVVTAGGNGNGATEFFTQATYSLRDLRNGNGETATAERQRNGGNHALGHYHSIVH